MAIKLRLSLTEKAQNHRCFAEGVQTCQAEEKLTIEPIEPSLSLSTDQDSLKVSWVNWPDGLSHDLRKKTPLVVKDDSLAHEMSREVWAIGKELGHRSVSHWLQLKSIGARQVGDQASQSSA